MNQERRALGFAQHIERLFVLSDAQPALRDGGLPVQPSHWRDVPQAAWEHWHTVPCIVLLGSPTMGKTAELEHQHARCLQQGQHAFFTRWRDWTDGDDLLEAVDNAAAFKAALASGEPVTWFIDALDEGRLQSQAAFARLQTTLKHLQRQGQLAQLRLRLSCRDGEWRANDEDRLRRLFEPQTENPAHAVVALRLLALTESAIRTLAAEKLASGAQVEAFMTAMRARHVTMLAGHPLVLALMLQQYLDGGQLGGDRTDIYTKAVDHLIAEENPFRLGLARQASSVTRRHRASEELAARLVLGGHVRVAWPEPPPAAGVLNAEEVQDDDAVLRTALETGLFLKLGDGSHGFFHRGFAEFLAARRLARGLETGWTLNSVLPLFPTTQGGVPSPLRETAAWLAGLVPDFQSWLVQHDPATACLGDTLRYTADNRLALVRMLAARYRDRRWQTEFERFGDLAATIPQAEMLRLLDRSNGLAVREMAINMVETSARAEFHELLAQRALDDLEDPAVRTRAVMVVAAADAAHHAVPLSTLLALDAALDPQDEIAGAVLHHLYPAHLSTGQALSALHVPRAAGTYGLFRQFWSQHFLQRLPASTSDRHLALQALGRLFAAQVGGPDAPAPHVGDRDAHHVAIEMRPLFGAYVELVVRELTSPDHLIEALGPHVDTARRWVHSFGHAETVARLEELIRSDALLKRELLNWVLDSLPAGSRLEVWDLPFIGQKPAHDDFDLYAEACVARSQQPAIAAPLFQQLFQLAWQFPAAGQIERLLALAAASPALHELWAQWSTCSLDDGRAEARRRAKEVQAQQQRALDGHNQRVRGYVGALHAGDVNTLVAALWEAGVDPFGEPRVSQIGGQFEQEVARAINEGLHRVWTGFDNAAALWPDRPPRATGGVTLPNGAIAASLGFQLAVAADDELHALSDAQLECVLWLSLNRDGDWLPTFRRAWHARPTVVWQRFQTLLDQEADTNRDAPDRLWSRLAATDEMPADFVAHVLRYAEEHALPHHAGARLHTYAFVRRHGADGAHGARMMPALRAHIDSAWAPRRRRAPEDEHAELAVLAMAWLLDSTVLDKWGAKVFTGGRHGTRALGFVNALQKILAPTDVFGVRWDQSSVPFECYAALVPYLFYEGSRTPQVDMDSLHAPAQLSVDARNRMVSHVASAPPAQAEAWFARWRHDTRFGNHRDWLASLHDEIRRQIADGQWQPLTRQECDAVLLKKGALVRNLQDVRLYLDDLLEAKVIPSFRTDHSLTSLLWSKKSGTRKRASEKVLQTAVYAAIRLLLRGTPVVGAREPEEHDAKKPDLRLSFVLDTQDVLHVPVEIKWSDNRDLWVAPRKQLLGKYMADPAAQHGIYLVAWADSLAMAVGPDGTRPETPAALRAALQAITDRATAGGGKTVAVHVIDVSVTGERTSPSRT